MQLGRTRSIRFSDTSNRFVAIGCDTIAHLIGMDHKFTTGCASTCNNTSFVTNGTCSSIGCCEIGIPKGLRAFTVGLHSYYNHSYCSSFSPCSYAFLTDTTFRFNASDFLSFENVTMTPTTLEWDVGNKTCEEAREEGGSACVAKNSECYNSTNGHHCNCSQGYEGNPYLADGCQGKTTVHVFHISIFLLPPMHGIILPWNWLIHTKPYLSIYLYMSVCS